MTKTKINPPGPALRPSPSQSQSLRQRPSLLMQGALARLGGAAVLIALLWLVVAWALGDAV